MLAREDKGNLERWKRLAMLGLKRDIKKAENLTTDLNEPGSIVIHGTELQHASVFKYLGSAIASYDR